METKLVVNHNKRSCTFDGKEYFLTDLEYKVMNYLDKHRDRLVPASELFKEIWHDENKKPVVVSVTLSRINSKLRKPWYHIQYKDGGYIINV